MLRIEMPAELADDLVADGMAVRPGTRGTLSSILIDTALSGATAVSLLQAPDTFTRLARKIKDKFVRRSRGVRMTVIGSGGKIDVEITKDTDVSSLAKLIQDGLLGKVK